MNFVSAPIKHLFNVSRHMADPKSLGDQEVFHYSLPAWHEYGDGMYEIASNLASGKLLISGGEILVSKLNPEKSVVIHAKKQKKTILCSPELIVLKPNRLYGRYAFYLMHSAPIRYELEASVESVTNSHKRARVDKFLATHVAYPDQPTQKSIADFLDRETTRIGQLIEKKQRLYQVLEEKESVSITLAVTGQDSYRSVEPLNEKIQDSILKQFPQVAHLPVRIARLGCVARIFSGGTPDKSRLEFWEDGSLPWIGSGEVNQFYVLTPTAYITPDAVQNSSTKLMPKGTIIMALAGQGRTKAMVAQMGIDAYGNQSLACIADYKGHERYLLWWLTSLYREIRALSSQDTRDGLNQTIVAQLPVPDFDFLYQQRIADKLDKKIAQIDTLKKKLICSIEKIKDFRSALITSAVTGQIDVDKWARRGGTNRRLDAIEEEMHA